MSSLHPHCSLRALSPSPLAGEGLGRGGSWKLALCLMRKPRPLSPALSREGRGSNSQMQLARGTVEV